MADLDAAAALMRLPGKLSDSEMFRRMVSEPAEAYLDKIGRNGAIPGTHNPDDLANLRCFCEVYMTRTEKETARIEAGQQSLPPKTEVEVKIGLNESHGLVYRLQELGGRSWGNIGPLRQVASSHHMLGIPHPRPANAKPCEILDGQDPARALDASKKIQFILQHLVDRSSANNGLTDCDGHSVSTVEKSVIL